ncbi:MAG: exodeoxyribonuclease V subunit beta [Francisella sp.]
MQKEDNTLFPDNISIITDGRKIRAKEVKNVFEGIRELRDFQQEINLSDAANFIKQACLTIRQDFIQAKEQSGILDFDDLITKLNQSVKRSPELVNALQKQYPVALIDEFQDTDDEQFQILDCIYPKDNKDLLLLMIGDPKQAIYRFRGGDIFTYLKAKDSCPSENIWSMDTNWRSTKDIIKAYNRLFYQTDYSLEEEGKIKDNAFSQGIGYQLVKASPNADNKSKNFNDELKAINYFYYQREDSDNKGDIDKKLSLWTANEIVRLLNSNTVVESDIAILVENSTQAKVMQQALKSKNLSSVYLSQRDNVYHSQEAKEILAIMEGINDLENKYLLKKALATSLLGSTASKFYSYLDENDTLTWDQEIEKAKYLRQLWVSYGFMAFIMHIIHNYFVPKTDFKERVITNILHLAELIKMAENKYKHPNQLIKWYRQQLNSSDISENEIRLENDDNLIKIITIHSSKGLEYSVVFIPFASYVSRNKFSVGSFFKYYNVNLQKTVYQIDNNKDIKDQVKNEVLEELLRLFYVAVTRAEHRCYIGVAQYDSSENSPLAKFLGYQKGYDWLDKIKNITNNPNNQSLLLDVNDMQEFNLQISNSNTHIDYNSLKANDISLNSDHWSLLSFSKISKSYIKDVALEKENDESDDEDVDLQRTCKDFRFRALRGADMGNLLHNILENTNFSSGKIDDSILQEQVDKYHIVAAEDLHNLKAWLEDCLVAPIPYIEFNYSKEDKSNLSNKDKSFCLKDIPNEKTLREVEFYFPVKNENLLKQDIIDILVEYRTSLNCNAKNIYIADNNKLFGMLHGFIDLIFEYGGKFYVADYKSNYLGDSFDDYNQEKMQDKNQSSLYDLQYLIYSVALDKYLKQHISSYNYEQHFGGVYYFYLRGMKDGFGVYKSRPSLKVINKLASLFSGD